MSHKQAPDPWAHLKPKRRKLVLDFGEVPPAPQPSPEWQKRKARKAEKEEQPR